MKQQVRTTLDRWAREWLTATAERRGCSVSAVLRGLVEAAATDAEGVAAHDLIRRIAEESFARISGEL